MDVAEVVTVAVAVWSMVQLLDAVVADEPMVWMVGAAIGVAAADVPGVAPVAADVPKPAPPDDA